MDIARTLGEKAALAMRHAQLYRRREVQNQQLVSLLETSRAMTASLDVYQVLTSLRDEVTAVLELPPGAVDVRVRLADGNYAPLDSAFVSRGDTTVLAETAGETPVALPPIDPSCRQVLRTLAPADLKAADGRPRLIMPLVLKNKAEGYIDVTGQPNQTFRLDQIELAQILANQAAVAVVNARLYSTIELRAITDGLTGLYNHRYFYERLSQEFARAQRYGLRLSLLMLDIDDFKSFNDRYGHLAGDQVLRKIAAILQGESRRHIDLAARYGGEEFAVLLPETPVSGAETGDKRRTDEAAAVASLVGERICHNIEQEQFATEDGTSQVTISVGIASFPQSATSPDELVLNADKALYLAKRLGKNRVEVYQR